MSHDIFHSSLVAWSANQLGNNGGCKSEQDRNLSQCSVGVALLAKTVAISFAHYRQRERSYSWLRKAVSSGLVRSGTRRPSS